MEKNYSAWNLKIEDFYNKQTEQDRMMFILRFAVLAPSSHNSQPWGFSISDNAIDIYREPSRSLPVADSNDRQLFLSIGCAIENTIVAGSYYGYSSQINYYNNTNGDHVATIVLSRKSSAQVNDDQNLIHSILDRKTNRNRYKMEVIDQKILQEISSLQTNDTSIYIVDNKVTISELGNIALLASIDSMSNREFREELSHYTKHNITRSKIGMPGFTLGLPTPVSFLLPRLIKHFNMEKVNRKQNQLLFKEHTPYIVIIATKDDSVIGWIKAGQIYQRLSLILTKYKVSTSPWGAPIQIGNYYENIQAVLKISERPQMFLRMGYSVRDTRHSPRIPHTEVMKQV